MVLYFCPRFSKNNIGASGTKIEKVARTIPRKYLVLGLVRLTFSNFVTQASNFLFEKCRLQSITKNIWRNSRNGLSCLVSLCSKVRVTETCLLLLKRCCSPHLLTSDSDRLEW